MWLFSKIGFFSAVACQNKDKTPDFSRICVRARVRQHLENLVKLYDHNYEILETPDRDYRYRIITTAKEWEGLVSVITSRIDYTNFKDSVATTGDISYETSLHNVWDVMYGLQNQALMDKKRDL